MLMGCCCQNSKNLNASPARVSPDPTHCTCLSPKCNVKFQTLACSQWECFNITQKKRIVHIIVTIFSFQCLSDYKKKKSGRSGEEGGGERGGEACSLQETKKKHQKTLFHFCLGVLLNTHLFTQYCLQKNICLI